MTSGQVPSKGPPRPIGLASIRRLAGTLVAVPLVAWLFGSAWTWERRVEPGEAVLVEAAGGPGRSIPTYLVPEGSQLERGILLEPGDTLTFALPILRRRFQVEAQVFNRDAFVLAGSSDGVMFTALWDVPAVGERGMRTRLRSFDPPAELLSHLRLIASGARSAQRVAGLRVVYEVAVVRHVWLGPALLGLWLALVAASRVRALRGVAGRLATLWQRLDPWLATALILGILLGLASEVLVVGVAVAAVAAAIVVFRHYFARRPWVTVVYVAFLYLLFFQFMPWALGRTAAALTSSLYDFTIDHRMRPDGKEINSDGIRFQGEATDLEQEDFVVLALGDSFTYGLKLEYEESYPYVLERLLAERGCTSRVRVVNFGWASSSPLLSLRLLEQIGAKYRPDLVVYNLDMTDFGDDLRYEHELRTAGDLEVDGDKLVREMVLAASARYPALDGLADVWARLVRKRPDDPTPEADVPSDRFFVTARPLDETRTDIERGVIKNLARIHRLSTEGLGAPMALIVYPRAYQYSASESPKNWERNRYRVLGPFVQEPFRFFREIETELPYPVIDLLPVFEAAEEFPLFLEDDPHWNRAGAALAARAVADRLIAERLMPCAPAAAEGAG